MRLQIWRKIGLSGDWCLCTTRRGACYYWIGMVLYCLSKSSGKFGFGVKKPPRTPQYCMKANRLLCWADNTDFFVDRSNNERSIETSNSQRTAVYSVSQFLAISWSTRTKFWIPVFEILTADLLPSYKRYPREFLERWIGSFTAYNMQLTMLGLHARLWQHFVDYTCLLVISNISSRRRYK